MAFASPEQAEIYHVTKSAHTQQQAHYVYQCNECGQWHFTKNKGAGNTKMRVHE